jgi:hypothetical protein
MAKDTIEITLGSSEVISYSPHWLRKIFLYIGKKINFIKKMLLFIIKNNYGFSKKLYYNIQHIQCNIII